MRTCGCTCGWVQVRVCVYAFTLELGMQCSLVPCACLPDCLAASMPAYCVTHAT